MLPTSKKSHPSPLQVVNTSYYIRNLCAYIDPNNPSLQFLFLLVNLCRRSAVDAVVVQFDFGSPNNPDLPSVSVTQMYPLYPKMQPTPQGRLTKCCFSRLIRTQGTVTNTPFDSYRQHPLSVIPFHTSENVCAAIRFRFGSPAEPRPRTHETQISYTNQIVLHEYRTHLKYIGICSPSMLTSGKQNTVNT